MRTMESAPAISDRPSLELFIDELAGVETRIRNLEQRSRVLRAAISRAMGRAGIAEVTTNCGTTAKLVETHTIEVG